MVLDHTLGVDAAVLRARVDTLLVAADPVVGALNVDDTLGLAVGREAHVTREAGAHGLVGHLAAVGVLAARRGLTGTWRLLHGFWN